MNGHKLIELLKTFTKKEMTRLREFAHSPYHNKHKKTRLLIDYFAQIYPDLIPAKLDRRVIFQSLFPEQKHNQNQLALLFTYSLHLAEEFQIQERFKEKRNLQDLMLLESLRLRKQYLTYEKVLGKSEKQLMETPHRNSQYFHQQYLLASEADDYHGQIQKREKDWNIQLKQNNLDYFFLAEKLKDAAEMHLRGKILNVDYRTPLLKIVVDEVHQNLEAYRSFPAILVYYLIYQMISRTDQQYYFEALDVFQQHNACFPENEQKEIYNYFQNFCIGQINQGNALFLKALFNLYQLQLKEGLLIEEGTLSEWHYKNIVTTGLRLQEMKWVRQFIDEYRTFLPISAQDNAYRFNLASFYYAARQYDKVLELLLQVEYKDLRYSLSAKALLLRTYFDLDEYEALYSLVDSFRQYLQRNKLIADSKRVGHLNLFKLTKRAAQLKANYPFYSDNKNQKEFSKLEQEVHNVSALFNKSWLLEKLKELKKAIS